MPKVTTPRELLVADLDADLERLAERVTGYVEDQTPLWRRLPRLALLSQGRTGFLDSTAKLYMWGLSPLSANALGAVGLHVGCSTGRIGHYNGLDDPTTPRSPGLVNAFLAAGHDFDASYQIARYERAIAAPISEIYQPGHSYEPIRDKWVVKQTALLDLIPEDFMPEDAVRLREYVATLPLDYD